METIPLYPYRGKFLKSPLKGPTRGSENFAQNVGLCVWGGEDFAVDDELKINFNHLLYVEQFFWHIGRAVLRGYLNL